MSRRKLENRFVRSLLGSGKTYRITLPKETIKEFGWRKKQKLQLRVDKRRGRIIIKDWQP